MARTKRSAALDSRNKRLNLETDKDFTETIARGHYIIYRRPVNRAGGSWTARWYDPATRKMTRTPLGMADDFVDADGVRILDWDQATKKAGAWFKEQNRLAHLRETGEAISDKPYTVADAIADYLREARLDGRNVDGEESFCKTRILPQLGEIQVGKLTKKKLKDWQRELAESPRRKTGWKTSEARESWDKPPTEQQQKSRKATANRVLTILKRALNVAVEEERYAGPTTPWRDIKPFKDSGSPRVRFLSEEEQQRLLNACAPDFRILVRAALYTGSRYSPLCRMKVRDFNAQAGTVWIEKDKGKDGGKSRHVVLGPKAIEWFTQITAGREPDELMFTRTSANRTLRKEGGNQWLPYDQRACMHVACEASKVERVVFHELRHTYASWLINQGVSLSYVAAQLGHASTRMVEKYYGHLAPNALAAAIRQAKEPDLPQGEVTVAPLKIKVG